MINPSSQADTLVPVLLLLSAQQLATTLSVSVKTIRRWEASDKLPRPLRLSSTVLRWNRKMIELWLAECEREGRLIDRREWESMVSFHEDGNGRSRKQPP